MIAHALIVVAYIAGSFDGTVPFDSFNFSADEGCQWAPDIPLTLHMSGHYIAGPKPGEDRDAWLDALHRYRAAIRCGLPGIVRMNYDGVRAWIRMAREPALRYKFKMGEACDAIVEARAVEGNSELCLAFDVLDAEDRKTGWSGVRGTATVPPDGQWHTVVISCTVPYCNGLVHWLRPILGMDATHNPARGCVEIRKWRLKPANFVPSQPSAADSVKEFGLVLQPMDLSNYARPDLRWASQIFTCHFTFLYDRSIYNPNIGAYTLDSFLEDGERAFGGYDAMVLWHAYPRLGFDDRNQFDMYRDMPSARTPGGLQGLRGLVDQAHARGVKVFIDYNPWDTGTRREDCRDEQALAEMIRAIDADGIFLDTMSAGSTALRQTIDGVRNGVAFEPEGSPPVGQLSICNASWAQWLSDPQPPSLLQLKWIEPRHMQHQIRRWDTTHRDEIVSAFFNGSGMLVWENIFGAYNPWPARDRALWRHASRILKRFASLVTSDAWDPFYPTLQKDLYANRWPGGGVSLFTIVNRGEGVGNAPLLDVGGEDVLCYDLWRGCRIEPKRENGKIRIVGDVDLLGCVLIAEKGEVPPDLEEFLERQRDDLPRLSEDETRNGAKSVAAPAIPPQREKTPFNKLKGGTMVFVAGGATRMRITHIRRECGCHPDPGTTPEKARDYLWGNPHDQPLVHDYTAQVADFYMDEAEVSNADFKKFVDETGYKPKNASNFLKHWPGGIMPDEIADLPVVYVDIEDARAYAAWAGKRLPAEAEWHRAATGGDGRKWPWGDAFDAAKCNATGKAAPVKAYAEGRSPCGCYNMAGNVCEWTESVRDDGHTRFAIVRGGSYYQAEGSIWYADGGPRPCDHHAKFILCHPGLDRCATIGFRCAWNE